MVIVPDRLGQNRPEFGDWLEALPGIIAGLEERWNITVAPPYGRLSFNYVAPARCVDGTPAVLKLFPPTDSEAALELEALAAFDGHATACLLAGDREQGAMLLERIKPGRPLHTLCDEAREVAIAVGVMRRIRRPVPPGYAFPDVADWGRAFDRHREVYGGAGPLPQHLFELGEWLYRDLDASATERMLIHGDLHHDNILSAEREEWLAIDPKGVVGDPLFEVGPLLLNLWEELYDIADPHGTLERRVDLLSEELGAEGERVRRTGIARCVLSAVWSAEDGGTGWGRAMEMARLLSGG